MIEAITFDLWNTLFEHTSYSDKRLDLLSKFLTKKNSCIQTSDLRELYNNYFSFLNLRLKTLNLHHVYTRERILNLLNDLSITPSPLELDQLINGIEGTMFESPPVLKKEVKKTLTILNREYKLGIISDTGITPGRIIRIALEQHKILKFFTTTIFSDEIGYYKPHPMVFKTALDNLGCLPENSIHVGDLMETDIKGAKDYKMYAIWIKDPLKKRNGDIEPDYKIDNISEVIEIVKSII